MPPICPAPSAKFAHCHFFPTAAAAQEAGFRPCLRGRPETAPEIGAWLGNSNTVRRALALIAEGALDGDDTGVEMLAARLGLGERQLRRLFHEHVGASPIAVAQTRRIHFAKQLIHETRLPMAEVAMAAVFGSEMGWQAGDVVSIQGKKRTAALLWPDYPEDTGTGVVRLDGNTRRNAGVSIDDRVPVKIAQAASAESVVFAPTVPLKTPQRQPPSQI